MASDDSRSTASSTRDAASLVFVGFNSRVVALDRDTGELVWKWKSPDGSGFPAVLLDGDRLIVSVQGYTHCLDPASGSEWWNNPLKGLGVGVPCLASVRGNTTPQLYSLLAQQELEQKQTGTATHASTT